MAFGSMSELEKRVMLNEVLAASSTPSAFRLGVDHPPSPGFERVVISWPRVRSGGDVRPTGGVMTPER